MSKLSIKYLRTQNNNVHDHLQFEKNNIILHLTNVGTSNFAPLVVNGNIFAAPLSYQQFSQEIPNNNILTLGELQASVFHRTTITTPVSAVVVPLPPTPYSVEIQFMGMRVDPASNPSGANFFGCDLSFDNGATWETSATTAAFSRWPNNSAAGGYNYGSGTAWVLTVATNFRGNSTISGSLFISQTTPEREGIQASSYSVAREIVAGVAYQTFASHGDYGNTSMGYVKTRGAITNVRFRWSWNPNMVEGVVRVLSHRMT